MPLETWWNPMTWSAPYPFVVGALFVIAFCRAGATYLVGRLLIRGGEHAGATRRFDRPGFRAGVARVNRWGAPAITLGFLTVGVQTMVNLAAGALRMPLSRYLPALALGALLWGVIYASVGFVGIGALVRAWETHPALAVGLAVLAAAGAGMWVRWNLRHPDDPVERVG